MEERDGPDDPPIDQPPAPPAPSADPPETTLDRQYEEWDRTPPEDTVPLWMLYE